MPPVAHNPSPMATLSAIMVQAQADIARRIEGVSASYRAAERHRLSDSRARYHRGVAGTADSHLRQSDRDELIARSRDADRNYPIARSLIDQHVDLVVGDGFSPKPDTGDKDVDKAILDLWHQWAERPEVTGRFNYDRLTEAAVRHVALDGGVLMVPTELEQVQMIGVQRLRSPAGAWDSLEWRGGVRVGQYGQPLEFNVVEWQRDGRSVKQTSGRRMAVTPNYESPFLLAYSRVEDQYIGEPALAPVLEDIGQQQDLIESVNQNMHVAALMALVHTTQDPTGTASMMGARDQTDPVTSEVRKLAPVGDSGIYTLLPGEDLKAVQGAQPTQNYTDVLLLNFRLIGAALCLPLELGILGFHQSNFHGALAAVEVAARRAERRQDWLVSEMHNPLYRWQVSGWAEAGLLGKSAKSMESGRLYKVEWRYPRRLVVDPKREAEVFQIMRKMGAMSLRDHRPDGDEVLRQIAHEEKLARELGVTIERTPGASPAQVTEPEGGEGGSEDGGDGGDEGDGVQDQDQSQQGGRVRLVGE